jgi:hypothetical protein
MGLHHAASYTVTAGETVRIDADITCSCGWETAGDVEPVLRLAQEHGIPAVELERGPAKPKRPGGRKRTGAA